LLRIVVGIESATVKLGAGHGIAYPIPENGDAISLEWGFLNRGLRVKFVLVTGKPFPFNQYNRATFQVGVLSNRRHVNSIRRYFEFTNCRLIWPAFPIFKVLPCCLNYTGYVSKAFFIVFFIVLPVLPSCTEAFVVF
jgi:hypothetical protein